MATIYDKPFRYSKKHNCYLVTIQRQTKITPSIVEVTPDGWDRALPKGFVEKLYGIREFFAYRYTPGFNNTYRGKIYIRKFQTKDEAIQAVLDY